MRTLSISFALAFSVLFSGCEGGGTDGEGEGLITDTEKHRRMKAEIDSLEQVVYDDDFTFDPEVVLYLKNRYDKFAERFGGDEDKSPEYLYKSGALSRTLGKPTDAVKTYRRILTKFDGYSRAPEVQFLIAFTYDEDLRQKELAREAYNDVIKNFPGDHWAVQAERRLETLDMTDEEMVRYFMERNGEEAQ